MPRFHTLALATATALIVAIPVHASSAPSNFNQIDTNADGVINFSEFTTFSEANGQTRTQAAQIFIDLANGDVLISKKEYLYGVSVADSPTWERGYALPDLEDDIESVEPAAIETTSYEPVPAIEITPNEEVAGEVIYIFEDEPPEGNLL
ncbi:MAG: hypothetical protein ACSHX3_02545 [Litorimonas sp.]